MRMTGPTDILGAAAEFNHRNGFSDQFRSGMMQNVSAKNAIGLCVGDELDHSFHIITAKGTAVSSEWKFTDAHIDPLLLRLVFSETNASQLGICVDDARNGLIVHMPGLACDDFNAGDPFVFGLMCQHRPCDDIADSINAFDIRAEMLVHFDADRKSTRLNSSHRCMSYAASCLKKKKTIIAAI